MDAWTVLYKNSMRKKRLKCVQGRYFLQWKRLPDSSLWCKITRLPSLRPSRCWLPQSSTGLPFFKFNDLCTKWLKNHNFCFDLVIVIAHHLLIHRHQAEIKSIDRKGSIHQPTAPSSPTLKYPAWSSTAALKGHKPSHRSQVISDSLVQVLLMLLNLRDIRYLSVSN